jgi:hypothetical protein
MIDLAVSALNMVGLLSLIGWQMVEHIPGNLHYLAIPALVAYTAVAVVDRQQKRPLLAQFNGSVAVVLFTIALPLALKPEDLSTDWLAPYWAAGSAFVWVIGNWLDRQLYRGEAYGIAALALAAALASNFQGRMTEHDPALWAAGLVAILLFEGYCEILRPGKSRETIGKKELLLGDVSLLAAVVLIAMAIWSVAEPYETGISWLVIGIVLIEAGGHHSRLRLRLQGYLLAAAAFIGFANFNIAAPEIGQLELSWRYTLAGAVLLYFASARLLYARWSLSDREGSLASLPAAVATVLFAGASYHALPSEIFPIAWVIWAVILLDTGGRLGQREIRWYAYGLGTAGFIASCQVNLIAATADGYLAGWGYALATAAGFYIMTARLLYAGWQLDKAEIQSAAAPSALATVLVAGAAYEALPSEVFPLVWAAWALLLLEIGGRISQLNIRLQAYLLGVAAFGCMIGFQLSDAASSAAIAGWLLALAGAGVLYLASQRLIFAGWQFVPIETQTNWVPAALATVIYAGAVWRALPTDLVSVGWIAWALILQQTGRRLKQGGIAMSGLALGVLALAAAIAINVYQVAGPADAVNLPNWAVLGLAIAALYAMHARAQGQVSMAPSDAFVSAKGFLHGATLLFALAVWRELPSIAVAVAWTALCVAAIELAERFERKALILQAQVLIVAAVVRLFMANFINPGEAFGLSHRLITVAPVIVTLYYLRALSVAGWASGPGEPKFISPSVYSWTAALLLVVLARFEVGREYAVAVWSPVFLALLALGLRIPDRDFRFQSYAIALLIFGRSWSTNLFLDGALFGLSERIVTVLPALAAIFAAVVIVPARGEHPVVALKGRLGRAFGYADLNARSGLAILFAFLLLILIFYEMSIDLVSVGWAAEALALFVLGFSLNERSFRFFGLGLLLVCLFKIVLLDLEGVETIYRILSFIVLGLVLLLVSFGYSRYRKVIERYI